MIDAHHISWMIVSDADTYGNYVTSVRFEVSVEQTLEVAHAAHVPGGLEGLLSNDYTVHCQFIFHLCHSCDSLSVHA